MHRNETPSGLVGWTIIEESSQTGSGYKSAMQPHKARQAQTEPTSMGQPFKGPSSVSVADVDIVLLPAPQSCLLQSLIPARAFSSMIMLEGKIFEQVDSHRRLIFCDGPRREEALAWQLYLRNTSPIGQMQQIILHLLDFPATQLPMQRGRVMSNKEGGLGSSSRQGYLAAARRATAQMIAVLHRASVRVRALPRAFSRLT